MAQHICKSMQQCQIKSWVHELKKTQREDQWSWKWITIAKKEKSNEMEATNNGTSCSHHSSSRNDNVEEVATKFNILTHISKAKHLRVWSIGNEHFSDKSSEREPSSSSPPYLKKCWTLQTMGIFHKDDLHWLSITYMSKNMLKTGKVSVYQGVFSDTRAVHHMTVQDL